MNGGWKSSPPVPAWPLFLGSCWIDRRRTELYIALYSPGIWMEFNQEIRNINCTWDIMRYLQLGSKTFFVVSSSEQTMDVALTCVNCFLWRILLHLAYVNHIQNFPHEMFSTRCHVPNAKCDVQNRFHHRHSFQRLLQEPLKTGRQHFGMIVTLRIIILRNFIMRFLGQDQSFLDPTFIQTYRYYIWTHMWFSNSSLPEKMQVRTSHSNPLHTYIDSSVFHWFPLYPCKII